MIYAKKYPFKPGDMVDEDDMIPHYIKGPCPLMIFEDNKVRCGAVLMENEAIEQMISTTKQNMGNL